MTDVLIADDHRLFTDLVSSFLVEHGFGLAGIATTEAETFARTRESRPVVCLVDPAALAVGPATTFLARLTHVAPGTKVIVLTSTPDLPGPRAAAAVGAVGHLPKTVSGEELVDALHRAARGEVGIGTAASEDAEPFEVRDDGDDDARRRLASLRARERECLGLIVDGASTEEMAERMGVTVATVRSHVRAVLAALGVHSRLGAASFALRHGLDGSAARAS
jgi:two-component system, NarL family, nitrate/nitrite response regulator NarL